MSGKMSKERTSFMRLVVQMVFSFLLASTLSNCSLVGASKDKLLKSVHLSEAINLASISLDGQILAAVDKSDPTSGNYAIKIIQISDGRTRYLTDKYPVYSVAFDSQGTMFGAAGRDGVRIFRTSDGRLLRTIEGNQIFSLAFSPDGQTVATGGAEGEVEIWRVSDGVSLHRFQVGKWISSLAFTANGEELAAGTSANIGFVRRTDASTEDNSIVLWHVNGNEFLGSLSGHKYGVLSLAFSDNGDRLASGGADGIVKIWSVQERSLLRSKQMATRSGGSEDTQLTIDDLAFSPDNKTLAVTYDAQVVLMDSETLTTQSTLEGHTKPVLRVHFNRAGTEIASVSEDQTIRIWKVG
jgi:WD40 repeat protein